MRRPFLIVIGLVIALAAGLVALRWGQEAPPRPERPTPESALPRSGATPIAAGFEADNHAAAANRRETAQVDIAVLTRHGRRPVAGAKLAPGGAAPVATTDAAGHAQVARGEGARELTVTADGYQAETVVVPATGETTVTVLLVRATEVTGVVVDGTHRPVTDCRIEVVAGVGREATTTDARGAFCIDGLPGRFCIALTPPPGSGVWRTPTVATLAAGDRDVTLVLERETAAWAQARVVAVDAATHAPLPIRQCELERVEPDRSVFQEAPDCLIDAGAASLDAVAGGAWRFAIEVEDGRRAAAEIDLTPGQRRDVQIAVHAPLTLRGVVRGAAGQACSVMLDPPSGSDARHPGAYGSGFAACDEDGSFEFTGVAARPCQVRVATQGGLGLAGWSGRDTGPLTVVCHDKVALDFELGAGVALDGVFVLQAEDGSWRDIAITSPAGDDRTHVRCWLPAGPVVWEYRYYDRDAEGRAAPASRTGRCVAGVAGVQTVPR